jgi:hypothetical protein
MVQPAVNTLFADPAHPAAPLPADVTPEVEAQPSFRDRGQFRRRLRYLRRVRELGFRDLGGLVFDLHRFQRSGDELIAGKLAALDAVDRELRALERVLRDEQAFTDLREPGIAACARCGALHGSDARFCPSCGVSLTGPRTLSELPVVAPAPVTAPVAAPIAPLTWGPAPADTPQPAPVAEPGVAAPAAPDAAPGVVAPAAPVAAPGVVAPVAAAPIAEPPVAAPAEPAPAEAPAPEVAAPVGEPATEVVPPAAAPAPEAEGAPAADATPAADPEVVVSAAESGDEPVSAAAHGLPVPPPPPVPPLPGEADGDRS